MLGEQEVQYWYRRRDELFNPVIVGALEGE